MLRKILIEIVCFVFILVFAYASLAKLLDYDRFAAQIGSVPFISRGFAHILAILIPAVEGIAVTLFVFPALRRFAFFLAITLMSVFTLYVTAILTIASSLACSCGGILGSLGWPQHLMFNVFLLALAIVGARCEAVVRREVFKGVF